MWAGSEAWLPHRVLERLGQECSPPAYIPVSARWMSPAAGVRIMEVRQAYATEDFEWGNLKRLAIEGLEQQNTQLLRDHAAQRFGTLLNQAGGASSSSDDPSSEQTQKG